MEKLVPRINMYVSVTFDDLYKALHKRNKSLQMTDISASLNLLDVDRDGSNHFKFFVYIGQREWKF